MLSKSAIRAQTWSQSTFSHQLEFQLTPLQHLCCCQASLLALLLCAHVIVVTAVMVSDALLATLLVHQARAGWCCDVRMHIRVYAC